MKLAVDKTERTFCAGVEHQQKYVVSQSAHIMNLLADSTYSNKIGSPMRELMTNAVDSHIAAKSDKAIDVHIPTYSEPYFSIRDYGEGLSFDALTEVYTTYGESTKQDSNDFNGCMGIGSKSPFAYAKSFTTISYYNGKQYICLNSKDEENNPIFSVLSESDTDQPNGLEIKYKVDKSNIYSFKENAAAVFRLCPIDINWIGEKITLKSYKYHEKFQNIPLTVQLYDNTLTEEKEEINITFSIKDTSNSTINMGFVEYPIDSSFFKEEQENTEKRQQVTTYDWYKYYEDNFTEPINYVGILGVGLEINVDIGVVQMHMSREHLQYTKRVINVIKSCLCKVHECITNTILDDITTTKYLWTATAKREAYKSSKFYHNGFKDVITNARFNGLKIQDNIDLPEGVTCIRYTKNGKSKIETSQKCDRVYPRHNHHVYIADRKTGNVTCAKEAMSELERYDVIYVFSPDTKDLSSLITINPNEIKKLSDIQYDPVRSTYKKTSNVYELDYDSWRTPVDFDFKSGGIYCVIHRWEAQDVMEYGISASYLQRLVDHVNVITNTNITLYGVKKAASAKFEKSKHWMSLAEFLNMVSNASIKNYGDKILEANSKQNVLTSGVYQALRYISRYGNTDLPDDLKDFMDVGSSSINGCESLAYLYALKMIPNNQLTKFLVDNNNYNPFKLIDEKYPFLKCLKDKLSVDDAVNLCKFLNNLNNNSKKV